MTWCSREKHLIWDPWSPKIDPAHALRHWMASHCGNPESIRDSVLGSFSNGSFLDFGGVS